MEACSIMVDVLAMIDIELGALDDDKTREKFIKLIAASKVGQLVICKFLNKVLYLEVLYIVWC